MTFCPGYSNSAGLRDERAGQMPPSWGSGLYGYADPDLALEVISHSVG